MLLRHITLGVLVAALTWGCDASVQDDIAQSSLALKAKSPDVSCTFKHIGGAKKCDGKTKYTTHYKGPGIPGFQFKAASISEARAKCGTWAVDKSTPLPGKAKAECPVCPNGTNGCDVQPQVLGAGTVKALGGGVYECRGGKLKVVYTCSVCQLDAATCGEVIGYALEQKALDATDADEAEEASLDQLDDADSSESSPKKRSKLSLTPKFK